MKKIILSAVAVFAFGFTNAQSKSDEGQTSKGKYLIEANTNFGSGVGSTSFGLISVDGRTFYNIGAEAGYFVADDLAIKLGLGYGNDGSNSTFAYKLGAKYYVNHIIPVELSYNGFILKGTGENPSYLGIGAGYAIFLGKNVSLEPGLRYNNTLNKDFYKSSFQFNVGFALHF